MTQVATTGKKGGRPKSPLSNEKKLQIAKKMYADKTIPVEDIYKGLGIPRSTFYKYLKAKDTNLIIVRSGKTAPISLAEK